jgi:hypothetical protein
LPFFTKTVALIFIQSHPSQSINQSIIMSTEKSETLYVDASAVDAMAIQNHTIGRRAHLCCGSCCDTRRATIIVNIINITSSIFGLVGIGMLTSSSFADQFDDDAVKSELAVATSSAWVIYLLACLSIVCGGLGIYGAKEYKGWMVLVSGVWYAINAVLSVLGGAIGGAVMSGLFAYPHFVFYQEMKKGIMTKENYPNEKYSCCCV